MPIHDQSYRHWEGTFKSHTFRWWVITKEGFKILLQRKLFLIFVMGMPVIYLIFNAGMIYLVTSFNIKVPFLPNADEKFFHRFLSSWWTFLFMLLMGIFGGSGLIANDLKNNTLQLYLSKPLTRIDYLIGKLAIIVTLLGFVTILPSFILFIERVLLSNDLTFLKEKYWVFGAILLYSLILILPTGFLILALSSLTKSNRYAAISFVAIAFFTPIVFQILQGIFHSSKMAPISFWANLQLLGDKLFGLRARYSSHWSWSLLVIVCIIGLCVWVLKRRIKSVEVVK